MAEEKQQNRYDIKFVIRVLKPEKIGESGDIPIDTMKGVINMNAPNRELVVRTALLSLLEEVMGRGHVVMGLDITSIEQTIDVPREMKGEMVEKKVHALKDEEDKKDRPEDI